MFDSYAVSSQKSIRRLSASIEQTEAEMEHRFQHPRTKKSWRRRAMAKAEWAVGKTVLKALHEAREAWGSALAADEKLQRICGLVAAAQMQPCSDLEFTLRETTKWKWSLAWSLTNHAEAEASAKGFLVEGA